MHNLYLPISIDFIPYFFNFYRMALTNEYCRTGIFRTWVFSAFFRKWSFRAVLFSWFPFYSLFIINNISFSRHFIFAFFENRKNAKIERVRKKTFLHNITHRMRSRKCFIWAILFITWTWAFGNFRPAWPDTVFLNMCIPVHRTCRKRINMTTFIWFKSGKIHEIVNQKLSLLNSFPVTALHSYV